MKYRNSVGEKCFDFLNYFFMIIFALSMIYPFYNTLIMSLLTPEAASSLGVKLFPDEITLGAYRKVLENNVMYLAYSNTIFRTVTGTLLSVVLCYSVAFSLSKKKLPLRNLFTLFFLFTMFFAGGIIPFYLLMKQIGLIDSRLSLIIPGLYSAWNIIIIRNYIASLPESLEEAAVVDGANPIYIMFKIMLPLSMPIVATVALWTAVGHWNAWFDAMIFINDDKKQVLQMILRKILMQEQMLREKIGEMDTSLSNPLLSYTERSVKSATIIATIGPILIAYPFAQKYFIKGIMIGSLKG